MGVDRTHGGDEVPIAAAVVTLLPRISGESGLKMASGAAMLRPTTVIWSTGYRPCVAWADGLPFDAHGLRDAPRSVAASMPGLYLVGTPFQFGLTSQLLRGVGATPDM